MISAANEVASSRVNGHGFERPVDVLEEGRRIFIDFLTLCWLARHTTPQRQSVVGAIGAPVPASPTRVSHAYRHQQLGDAGWTNYISVESFSLFPYVSIVRQLFELSLFSRIVTFAFCSTALRGGRAPQPCGLARVMVAPRATV
jgi:hypothetical protein